MSSLPIISFYLSLVDYLVGRRPPETMASYGPRKMEHRSRLIEIAIMCLLVEGARGRLVQVVKIPEKFCSDEVMAKLEEVVQDGARRGSQRESEVIKNSIVNLCGDFYICYPFSYGISVIRDEFEIILDSFQCISQRKKETTEIRVVR